MKPHRIVETDHRRSRRQEPAPADSQRASARDMGPLKIEKEEFVGEYRDFVEHCTCGAAILMPELDIPLASQCDGWRRRVIYFSLR